MLEEPETAVALLLIDVSVIPLMTGQSGVGVEGLVAVPAVEQVLLGVLGPGTRVFFIFNFLAGNQLYDI